MQVVFNRAIYYFAILLQENEQRRIQEEKQEKRRKAQAEIKAKPKGKAVYTLCVSWNGKSMCN